MRVRPRDEGIKKIATFVEMVEELTTYGPRELAELDALMHELSATSFCNEALLRAALEDANVHVYVIRADEGRIVAAGTLCIKHTLEFTIADIESVVVSARCRGRGYGKELMSALMEAARSFGAHHIQLTSNPARVAANRLYQALGFQRYETNCYKLEL
jgi:ribosomal protein S18 acetylase RimI-like enzyme